MAKRGLFQLTQTRFAELLADFTDPAHLSDRLLAAERRNVVRSGVGVKSFTLSMIETAIEVTDARVSAHVIPALEAGAWGIHVPHDLTWAYEHAEPPVTHGRFRKIADLSALPAPIVEIEQM